MASNFLLQVSSEFIIQAKTQHHLVDLLKKNALIRHAKSVQCMKHVDRALFLPIHSSSEADYKEPYSNRPQKLGFGCTLSSPTHHALILDTLHESGALRPGARVLDLGMGTGILTACFAYSALEHNSLSERGEVLGVDRVPDLVNLARICLKACPVTAPYVESGKVQAVNAYKTASDLEWDKSILSGTYDVIHLGFSLDPASTGDRDVQKLTSLLDKNGILLGGWGAELKLWDKSGSSRVVSQALLQPMERGEYKAPETRKARMERIKGQLDDWKREFAVANSGRAPSRDDLQRDSKARDLFVEYGKLSKL